MHLPRKLLLAFILFFAWAGLGASLAAAQDVATQDKAKQIWQLLDYLAVDYGNAVRDGQIESAGEYAEMQEFSQTVERQLSELPATPAKAQLAQGAAKLRGLIAEKAAGTAVAEQARGLAASLLAAYPVPMAPNKLPDLRRGAQLYAAQCASCHGAQGHGDGPLAAGMNPPPIALSDPERARERSVFSLQQIISHGVEGTAMPPFSQLSEDDRWAIAYFASTMSYTDAEREAGGKLWANDKSLHGAVPNLNTLTQMSGAELSKTVGAETARPLLAYLRSEPSAVAASSSDSLALAKTKLAESIKALEQGDSAGASRLALSAYLDGFEIAEPALAAKNKALFDTLEKSMGAYRALIGKGHLDEARDAERRLQAMLTEAQSVVAASSDDPLSTFLGAFTILLREGLEALLVVIAMVAFLKKADRTDVLPYVHAGWITALAGGGATWGVATYLVDLSGASREMTEGISAVFAAVVLLAVGIWMHQKSMAGRWQAYVKQKLSSALNRRSALMLFLLSFVTVYREVFETVLFYAALWTSGNGGYMLAGLGCGVAVLAVIAVILLRSSARLPIGQFFAASSALVAVLAFVLIGKGVAALQKVGVFDITPVAVPQIDLLGIYPSLQTLTAQLLILLIIVVTVVVNTRSPKSPST
jgi:high-affinity iron transporter